MPILGNIIKRGLSLGDQFERRNVDPLLLQTRTLRRLLRAASQTTFGKYYDFRELLKSPNLIEAFQQKVPVHNYDSMYERWWHMSLNHVENVTWPGKVRYFALSSGT